MAGPLGPRERGRRRAPGARPGCSRPRRPGTRPTRPGSPSCTRSRRTARRGPGRTGGRGCGACGRRSSRRCSRGGPTTPRQSASLSSGLIPKYVGAAVGSRRGPTGGGARTRAPGPVVEPARSSSHSTWSARQLARGRSRGSRCRARRASTPSSSTEYGAPSTRDRRVEHRVVVAAHVVHPRRRARRTRRGTPAYSSSVPTFGEVALHHAPRRDRARSISSIDAAVHHLGVRRLARLAPQDRADLVLEDVAEPSALVLAEVDVVGGGEGREQLARTGASSVRERGRAGSRRGSAPSTCSVVLGVRLRARRTRATWYGPSVVTSCVADRGVDDRAAGVGRRNVTTTSSGPTVISSASRIAARSTVRRGLRRPSRPESRHWPRCSPARRADRRDARTHSLQALGIVGRDRRGAAAAARAAATTAIAAVIAATSSAVASGEIDPQRRARLTAGRCRACAAGAAPSSCAASRATRTSTRRVSRGSMTSST